MSTVEELQCIGQDGTGTELSDVYLQTEKIDATVTGEWDSGEGFDPLGEDPTTPGGESFDGVYDGNGYEITNLSIRRGAESFVGVFASVDTGGELRDVVVSDAEMVGDENVGVLAGIVRQGAVVEASHTSGDAEAEGFPDVTGVGGLVGGNNGEIVGSSSEADVSGTGNSGGLVGGNLGVIEDSHADGDVWAEEDSAGGLVGTNRGDVTGSHAIGDVSANDFVGGLVGISEGKVEESYATGSASGEGLVAGLVGLNDGGTVSRSYSTAEVVGEGVGAGGVVALNEGKIEDSYSKATVESDEGVGGFVGGNVGTVSTSYSAGSVDASKDYGGFVGNNADEGEVEQSYWDVPASGTDQSQAGTGLGDVDSVPPAEEMTGEAAESNMEGFDFTGTWETTADDYPVLAWQDVDPPGATDNPFFDEGGEPLERGEVSSKVFSWLQNQEIDGVGYERGDISGFIFEWLQATN